MQHPEWAILGHHMKRHMAHHNNNNNNNMETPEVETEEAERQSEMAEAAAGPIR